MMPRLGEKYDIEFETMSRPREEYNTDAYFELDLPVAPAVMVGEEILVEGSDVSEEELESVAGGQVALCFSICGGRCGGGG